MTILSLNLFLLTQCDIWACLDAQKADILGGIVGGKYGHIPF